MLFDPIWQHGFRWWPGACVAPGPYQNQYILSFQVRWSMAKPDGWFCVSVCVCVCIFCEFSFFPFWFSWFGIQSIAVCNCVCSDVSLCNYYGDLVNNMELIPGINNYYCFEFATVWFSTLNYGRWWRFEPAEIPTISFLVRNGIWTIQSQVEKPVRWRTISWFHD